MTSESITTGKGDRRICLENGRLVRRISGRGHSDPRYTYGKFSAATPARLAWIMEKHGEPADIVAAVLESARRLAVSAQAASERHG